jgi:hypothetical protein
MTPNRQWKTKRRWPKHPSFGYVRWRGMDLCKTE